MDFSGLIAFVQRFILSATGFTNALFKFMTAEITIWDNVTVFEILFSGGIGLYLTASLAKWLIGIVT